MEEAGERVVGVEMGPLTTELSAIVALIVAILIAAAASDNLDDVRAWTLVTIVRAAYILSRGFARGRAEHTPFWRGRRRT